MVPDVKKQGRPIWKHFSVNWFISFHDYVWKINSNYENYSDSTLIHSSIVNELSFNHTDWKYLNNEKRKYIEGAISVEVKNLTYPQKVTVIEAALEGKGTSVLTGDYSKFEEKTFNMRPYYKKGIFFLFFLENRWNIGETLGQL